MNLPRLPLFKGVLVAALSCLSLAAQTNQDSKTALPVHKESIVVTGDWQPLPMEEADRSVNQYQLSDPPLLFGSFSDVFDLDSSVFVESRGANGTQADFSVRGGSFDQTLMLLNGMRLNDEQSGHYNSDFPIPLDAVDHIEILRGSGSTLYGSDAVTGVINIITRPPTDADPVELKLRADGGNFGTNDQSGLLALKFGAFSERTAFERDFSTGFMDDRDYRNLAFSSDSWLKTKLGLSRLFLGYDDRPFGANQFYGNFNSWERTKTWFAALGQDLGKNTVATASYRRHTDIFELFRTDPSFYTNVHTNYQSDFALRRHDEVSRNSQLFYGAEFIQDHVDSNNLGVHTRDEGAIYGGYDIRALRRASLSIGVREEIYGSGENFFAPSVSGGYWVSSKLKARAAVSRAFRLPSFTDLYYHDPANIGNVNLKPEQAWNYEGGVDWIPGERWRLSGTVFERRERDDIDYVRANADTIWRATNFNRVHFTGFEGALRIALSHSQVAEVQFTSLRGAEAALGQLQSKYAFNYPVQQAVLAWQGAAKGWTGRVRTGIANQYQRSAYAVLDASIAYTQYWLRPYVRATNLTDTSYEPIYGILMPGRAAVVGIEICPTCRNK